MSQAATTRRTAYVAILFALTASARADALPAASLSGYAPAVRVAGQLRGAGADTMFALMDAWSTRFGQAHPQASIATDRSATLSAQGMAALLEGKADFVTFVREPFDSERAAFMARFGYPLTTIRVAGGSYATKGGTHAIAIYVHASNPLSQLTLAQLDAALSRSVHRGAARQAMTWGELGATGAWRNRPLHVYGMLNRRSSGNPPGIVNYVTQRVLLGGAWRKDVREQIDRPGETALEGIVARVAEDPDGIGYSGFGYAREGVKTLALAESAGQPYYAGLPAEVARQDYPLSRAIYLGINAAPGAPLSPLLREFLRFVLSADGQGEVERDHMHFIPLNSGQAAEARSTIP
jgi:phosphate transport system substrate-binding protein